MNVLGHACIAEGIRPGDVPHTLGAVLPDLAAMAGVHLTRPPHPSALIDGVRCHHGADAAFHALPAFVGGTAVMRAELLAAGLGTGPARAVAHVGFELLLDGTLVDAPASGAYRRAVDLAATTADVDDVIAAPGRERWHALLDRLSSRAALPAGFHEPAGIARRLLTILGHRPRLALAPDDVPLVTATLERHADAVRSAAPAVLSAVRSALRT